jgi:hypothetical protein
MSTANALPDLLRRFVATPYRYKANLHSTIVMFETNDQELFTTFRSRAEQLAGVLVSSDTAWHWKVVRDPDVSQDGEATFLLSGETLSVLFLGAGTVVAIDWNQGELLGFVASNNSPQHLLDALIEIGQKHHRNCDCGTLASPQ